MQKNRERVTFYLVLAIFAAAVVNLSLFSTQIDLTSTGAYTVSQASKDIVARAKENVYLTYYLSKQLKAYLSVTQSISDFVEEYAAATGGKIKVRIVDPKDSGELGDMDRLGIQGNQIQVSEQSQMTEAVVYSGIELSYLDRHAVLPVVGNLETLEYDLSSRLNQLINQKTITVGLLIGDPSKSLDRDYKTLQNQLQSLGTFKVVQPGQPIGGDVNVLIVAGNKTIDSDASYFIDQYIMNGGKVLFAMDSVGVDISSNNPPTPLTDNPGLKLLPAYGVTESEALVMDAYNNIVQFNSNMGGVLKRYVEWPQILPQNTSTSNPVTSHFAGLSLMWASPLETATKPGVTATVLATTSDKSWLMKTDFTIDPDQAYMSSRMPGVKVQKYPVVLALTGRFPSAFTPQSVPKAEQAKGSAPFQSLSPETRILVVGGSNWLTDLMNITQSNSNVLFAEAAVDWLAQDDALLKIKTRSYRDKSLTALQDDAARQMAAFNLSFVNVGLVPLIVLVVGVARFLRRRSRELKN